MRTRVFAWPGILISLFYGIMQRMQTLRNKITRSMIVFVAMLLGTSGVPVVFGAAHAVEVVFVPAQVISPTPAIVVSEQGTGTVVGLTIVSHATACVARGVQSDGLIEALDAMNLNQPADCFTLALGRVETQPRLAVAAPGVLPRLLLASHGTESLSSQPVVSAGTAHVSVAVTVLNFMDTYVSTKMASRVSAVYFNALSASSIIFQQHSLSMLGVFRC